MKRNKLVLIGLALLFTFILLPTQSFASEDFTKTQNQDKPALALQKPVEKQKLNKLTKNGQIKLDENKPLIINFKDGSKIKYELEVIDKTSTNKLNLINTNENQINATNKIYVVKKTYFYGTASLIVKLYTDVSHSGRTVTIHDAFDGRTGSFADWFNTGTRIIDQFGQDSDYATSEAWGDYSLYAPKIGKYHSNSYRIRANIDSAGAAYLVVID